MFSNVVAKCFRVQQKVYTRFRARCVWERAVKDSGQEIDGPDFVPFEDEVGEGRFCFRGARVGFPFCFFEKVFDVAVAVVGTEGEAIKSAVSPCFMKSLLFELWST